MLPRLGAPLKKKEILDEFADVSTRLSCMEGEYPIKLDDTFQHVIDLPPKVSYSLLEKLKAKF